MQTHVLATLTRVLIGFAIGSGLGTIANGVFSPGQEGYLEDNGFDPAQDIAGAQALIDDYKAATGATTIDVTYGHTATAIGDQTGLASLVCHFFAHRGLERFASFGIAWQVFIPYR